MKLTPLIALLLLLLLPSPTPAAEISKADRLFMQRGLGMHALCFWDHVLHPKTLTDAGFTGTTWAFKVNPKQLAELKGLPWCKWVEDGEPFTAEEKPFLASLVAIQFHDEQNLNDDKTLANAKKWFETMKPRFPNAILYTNQYGGLLTDANMQRYIETCHPDMLSFDTYPMWEDSVNWRSYFGDLQRYRAFSTAANIPFATWMQTFHGENKYRDPSESELRLDIFGAWTFGAKMQTCFTYNAGSSSLFKKTFNGSGDTAPIDGYRWLQKILRESRALSPHLVKLRSTDARWILGKNSEYPWGVAPWQFDKSFPELRGLTVKNPGPLKNGDPGDATIGFFKPLEGNEAQKWFMITNALTDPKGSAADCTQKITLNLVLQDGDTVQIANRTTGKLQPAPLKQVGETGRNLLELDLPGGTGELICITTK
jgi:hypothetical protein